MPDLKMFVKTKTWLFTGNKDKQHPPGTVISLPIADANRAIAQGAAEPCTDPEVDPEGHLANP